ncbi:MAG: hypothetical protein M1833_003586 [Piccolia ochrophora]|nr:MAG: hypothetical protein M1833_003586 [Piccolia ochrophora]
MSALLHNVQSVSQTAASENVPPQRSNTPVLVRAAAQSSKADLPKSRKHSVASLKLSQSPQADAVQGNYVDDSLSTSLNTQSDEHQDKAVASFTQDTNVTSKRSHSLSKTILLQQDESLPEIRARRTNSESMRESSLSSVSGSAGKADTNTNTSSGRPELSFQGAKENGQAEDQSQQRPMLRPFRRWMSTLRRKGRLGSRSRTDPKYVEAQSDNEERTPGEGVSTARRQNSSSFSSMAFVRKSRAASMSLASLNVHQGRNEPRSGTRNSFLSNASAISQDICQENTNQLDEGVKTRHVKRRQILDELISTEEGYVADLKVLSNVYLTLLASMPSLTPQTRSGIQRNIAELLQLHQHLLEQLHRVVPQSDHDSHKYCPRPSPENRPQGQWSTLDHVSEEVEPGGGRYIEKRLTNPAQAVFCSPTAEPSVAANAARIFDGLMKRFFAYEEYGANYDTMLRDAASSFRGSPERQAYNKGIGALANILASIDSRDSRAQRSSKMEDLFIKPLQRVCRYQLLFSDLCKHTPVYDCPESHIELEKVLYRLRETTFEINRATSNPEVQARIEKTWLLQDRLIYKDERRGSQALTLRILGHVQLCGVLFVAWNGSETIRGEFLICVLYRSCLILATTNKDSSIYVIVARIELRDIRIEAPDNGKDLQCYTAPFSWKVLFESDHQLYEMLFCACSAEEETAWTSTLKERAAAECGSNSMEFQQSSNFLALSFDIKPLADALGQCGAVVRHLVTYSDATATSHAGRSQVIIRNTFVPKDGQGPVQAPLQAVNRSQSLLSTQRTPVLAPKRTRRIQLENILSDVWTRDVLPYPGMGSKRNDHPLRASATLMMRKLSKASIASTFSRRSTSNASERRQKSEGSELESQVLPKESGSVKPLVHPTQALAGRDTSSDDRGVVSNTMRGILRSGTISRRAYSRSASDAATFDPKTVVTFPEALGPDEEDENDKPPKAATTSPKAARKASSRLVKSWSVGNVVKRFA